MEINQKIMGWYRQHKRDLPWRKTKDPYAIWVSEIILQQTRINQGMDYFRRFMERFPDVATLAGADPEDVLLVWQGLGYYSRARNMHQAARTIQSVHKGVFPSTYEKLIELKGVGPYTAAAIASIAFGEKQAVVDGNVHRLISRLFGIGEPPGASPGRSAVYRKAAELLYPEDPGTFNQAMMEVGSMICAPTNPKCADCPLSARCHAKCKGLIAELPVARKPIQRRKRYFHYLVVTSDGNTWIRQRNGKDIWKCLFEFPMVETAAEPDDPGGTHEWQDLCKGQELSFLGSSDFFRHQLTHQEIHARFHWYTPVESQTFKCPRSLRIHRDELPGYPMPVLIRRSIKALGWMEWKD